jgi:hypothetical protein
MVTRNFLGNIAKEKRKKERKKRTNKKRSVMETTEALPETNRRTMMENNSMTNRQTLRPTE